MGVGDGIYMYIVVVKKSSRSLSHLLVSSCNSCHCQCSKWRVNGVAQFVNDSRVLDPIRPRPTTAVKLTWQKLHIAVFIAPLFYEKIGLTLPGHIGVACNTDTDRIGIPESRKNVAWTFCVRG